MPDIGQIQPFTLYLLGAITIVSLVSMIGYLTYFFKAGKGIDLFPTRLSSSPWGLSEIALVFLVFLTAILISSTLSQLISSSLSSQPDTVLVASAMILQLTLLAGLLLIRALKRIMSHQSSCSLLSTDMPLRKIVFIAITAQLALWPLVVMSALGNAKILEFFGYQPEVQKMVDLLLYTKSPALVASLLFMAVILAPLTEELLFREFLYRFLKGKLPRVLAMVLSSLVFALIHDAAIFNVLPLFLLGCIFVMAYERTGSLLTPIIMHATFNSIQCLMLLSLRTSL